MSLIKIIEKFETDHKVENVDLINEDQLKLIESLSEKLFTQSINSNDIHNTEIAVVNAQGKFGLLTHTAIKVAKSKKLLSEIQKPIHLSIIMSLYKSGQRISGSIESETGENALIKKINQIKHLVKGLQNITWDMICVDNGCPQNSGKIAVEILKKEQIGSNVLVIFDKSKIVNDDDDFSNSHIRKLAALEFGMKHALKTERENHVIIYADTALIIHLGQCGLLVNPIINHEYNATIGSGREPDSIIIKTHKRNVQEKLFIYFRKRLLKRLNYITDIRYGFQAYSADFLRKVFVKQIENLHAFDFELLLMADLIKRKSIQNVAISRIRPLNDSSKLDEYPYLLQLKSFVKMYHKYLSPNAASHKYAYFIKSLTDQDWIILSENVPEGIQIKPAVHFDIYDEYSIEDFKKILEKNQKQDRNM